MRGRCFPRCGNSRRSLRLASGQVAERPDDGGPRLRPSLKRDWSSRANAQLKRGPARIERRDEGWRGACARFGRVGASRGRDTRTLERIVKAFWCRGGETFCKLFCIGLG